MSDTTGQLIEMGALRSKLLAVQSILRDACIIGAVNEPAVNDLDEAQRVLDEAIALLYPKLDPDANHPEVPRGPIGDAIRAAHQVLLDGGVENPVEILIVQTHDDDGQTTGRTAASSVLNAKDLLRIVLRNLERMT